MMKVWFLNVGHGDCTIIEHPSGRISMIDINNSQSYDPESQSELLQEEIATYGALEAFGKVEAALKVELDDPIAFFRKQFGNRPIFRFVLTHPDLDHMRGLRKLFENIRVINFWDTQNTKPTPSFRPGEDKSDWEFYHKLRSGGVPDVKVLNYTRGTQNFALNREPDGSDGGDGIQILSPSPQLVKDCNDRGASNDISLALRIEHHGVSVLLPGDAEGPAWTAMVRRYGDKLKSTVLKASHHGRESGFDASAMKEIDPKVVVVSVGRKPSTDAHRKYKYHCANVKSTRRHGTIELVVNDDGKRNWYVDRNPDP